MAKTNLDIDHIYKTLARFGYRTAARKVYVDYLMAKFIKVKDQNILKKLFSICKMHNNPDCDKNKLGELCVNDPEEALSFAWTIWKSRWEPGEAIIRKDAEFSYCYAKYVLKLSDAEAKKWGHD